MPAPKRAKSLPQVTDDLADNLVRAVAEQRHAGRVLHDDIGPLLSTAGLRLHLLRMDFPDAIERVREVTEALEDAMERVRALSEQLNPSPVYRLGFKNAVADLVERRRRKFAGKIVFTFATAARLPVEAAVAMYEAVAVALSDAVDHADATRIDVSIRGARAVKVRVSDNGTGRRSHRPLALAALLARQAGLTLEVATERGTIVLIDYALRRPSR